MNISKYQAFFWLLLSFLGGVLFASFYPFPSYLPKVLIIIGLCGWMTSWRRIPIAFHKRWPVIIGGLCLIFFAIGAWRLGTITEEYHILGRFADARMGLVQPYGPNKGLPVVVQGYIDEIPTIRGNQQLITIAAVVVRAEAGNLFIDAHERVLITVPHYPRYRYGQQVEVIGDVYYPQNSNSSDFDYSAYLAKDGIYTVMRSPQVSVIASIIVPLSRIVRAKIAVYSRIYAVRSAFEISLRRAMSEPSASLSGGVLFGTGADFPSDVKNDFSKSGISHIVAVSGYNITIIIGVISWLSLIIMRRKNAFWLAAFGVFCFTIFTGAGASVVRAAIMGIVALIAKREGRQSDAVNSLILAAFLMVLYQPMILRYDVGFQLSFMATLGLIYLSPIIGRLFKGLSDTATFREILIMTCSAQLAVLPLILYYFKNLSLVSLPANILILPAVPFLMLAGFVAAVAGMLVPVVGTVLGVIPWIIASYMLWLSHALASIP